MKNRFNLFHVLSNSIIDILAPRICEVCGDIIEDEKRKFEFICRKCDLFLPPAPGSDFIINRLLQNFQPDDLAVTQAFGLFNMKADSDYIKIVHGLKYHGFKRIGTEFGTELAKRIISESDCSYDGIVAVPIHHARMRERGFNQSDIIAAAISGQMDIPVLKPIKRRIYTTTQTALSKAERKKNIVDAIIPRKRQKLSDSNYLLIDDVLTTGSTVNECAMVLLEMGARRIDCAVLAVA